MEPAVLHWRDGISSIPDGADEVRIADAPRALGPVDRVLFGRGFLRVGAGLIYRRSSRIDDPNKAGGDTESTIQMSNFGKNAGFANQLFQYAFLKLYGLRHNAAVETPEWAGEKIYGIPHRGLGAPLRMWKGDEWSVRDLALWDMARPPLDVDFWGYYQNVPACWAPHREFVRRLYRPRDPWRAPVERWLARHRPPGATLVALHLRRGDYRTLGAEKPWFRPLPEEFYRRWLKQIWPTLANPVLFIASDDRDAVLPAFAEFAPITAAEGEAEMPEPRFLADFAILAAADVLALCNSSFSRMAAILAADTQRAFIPELASGTFEPYEPWATDRFWQRFGAPEPRPKSRVPRFLRRWMA
ncbi:MAG TPA: alpha-1,2-fucosyltransferase [Stellaceae bacterium]|nr:alpha-1,2-fucosyltransferase [Stellaceae bacterium]